MLRVSTRLLSVRTPEARLAWISLRGRLCALETKGLRAVSWSICAMVRSVDRPTRGVLREAEAS